ncbi:MAG: DNA polymerase III subunit beta [Synergistaceae bacterium]|jgi:DNA polymerase-3 subunit beta|nr:DNA polymerase III subunit beta [Synergistaceae bacterium]
MKISVDKETFIKNWNIAEKNAATSGSMNIFSTVRLTADSEKVELQSTDIRTSVICRASGVTVIEPGEAVIPIKGVSDLFKKSGSSEFTLHVNEGQAVMISGKSRYKFSTYPVGDFPDLPSSSGGSLFCSVKVSNLISVIEKGMLCATSGDEFPQYLSSAYFDMNDGILNVVSTDKRRLALCGTEITDGEGSASMMLPIKGIKELLRILSMIDQNIDIKIILDDAQAFFAAEGLEFAIRRIETKFPDYLGKVPSSHTTFAEVDKLQLLSAIERVDVVVRDYNRTVMLKLAEDGECVLSGRAQEFGEAVENIQCKMTGEPVLIGFNTRFFFDAVKAIDDSTACLFFNGGEGHMMVKSKGSDNFICLVAPMDVPKEEIKTFEADSDIDVL